jgi:hypothetical protein
MQTVLFRRVPRGPIPGPGKARRPYRHSRQQLGLHPLLRNRCHRFLIESNERHPAQPAALIRNHAVGKIRARSSYLNSQAAFIVSPLPQGWLTQSAITVRSEIALRVIEGESG